MITCDHCNAKGADGVIIRGPLNWRHQTGASATPIDISGDLCQDCQAVLRRIIKDFMHVPSTLNEHA